MSKKRFHLAWFLQGSSIQSWGDKWSGNISEDWMNPTLFIDMAKAMERAAMDYILIEDSIYVGQNWNDSREVFLYNGMSIPRQEPSVVGTLLAGATSRLGIVPTLSTFAYHPYLTARIIGTLDQVSGGRAGYNMVTGSSDYSAMNFGMDRLPDHDLRYDMAEEYIQICKGLWGSWEPGAIVADRKSGMLIDHTKVHTIDYKGQYYASRGPLNSGPCPQGQPVIAQAGGSPKGKAFAARYADTIVSSAKGVPAMKAYRDDVRQLMVEDGRDPDLCKVLFLIQPLIGDSEAHAKLLAQERREAAAANVELRLARLGWSTNIDFSGHDLDAPVGQLTTNGHQFSLAQFLRVAGDKTLREAIIEHSTSGYGLDLVGTVEQVADEMEAAMAEIGGDGFLIEQPNVTRRAIGTITDGLIPELQQRNAVRREYDFDTLRENLLAF